MRVLQHNAVKGAVQCRVLQPNGAVQCRMLQHNGAGSQCGVLQPKLFEIPGT